MNLRIIVCVKQVVDLDQVRMNRETKEPVVKGLPMIVGQIEKNALEEAAKIKESGQQAEVVVLSVGTELADDVILETLARGADKSVTVIDKNLGNINAQGIAHVLAGAIKKIGGADVIMVGEGSTDDNSGQIGSTLAQILGTAFVPYARTLALDGNKIKVTQSFEDYFEIVETPAPAVITITSEINEPRIPAITDVMDASMKPQDSWTLSDIGLSADELKKYPAAKLISNKYPEQTRKGVMLKEDSMDKTVDALIKNLQAEGVLEK
jgi:electron transfer flavoprotein beta subunit